MRCPWSAAYSSPGRMARTTGASSKWSMVHDEASESAGSRVAAARKQARSPTAKLPRWVHVSILFLYCFGLRILVEEWWRKVT